MTINKNSTEQINVALLDLENKIKRNNQTAAISALENDITLINNTLKEKQNGLVPGETYNINISGNATTSNHALTADNATTADSANIATSAGHANTATTADSATSADNATHADNADYATTAGSASIAFPEGFVYIQLNGKSNPAQMNMSVPDGCAWVDISASYASFPYIKIGSGTTQSGKVLNHTHGMQHHHSMRHRHSGTTGGASMYGGWDANAVGFWYNIGGGGAPSIYNLSSANYRSGTATINHGHGFTTSNNTGAYADTSNQESRFTSGAYSGTGTGTTGKTATDGNDSENTTNEVNATYAIVWEVQRL